MGGVSGIGDGVGAATSPIFVVLSGHSGDHFQRLFRPYPPLSSGVFSTYLQNNSHDLDKGGRRAQASKEELGLPPIGRGAVVDQPVAPRPLSFSVPSICRHAWMGE